MSYTPTIWVRGDTASSERLNKLETAVGEMNMSYSPHTWVTDEDITAARLNALEQGVAAGGGGSSDYSTAELTVIGYNGLTYFQPPIFPCLVNNVLKTSLLVEQELNEQSYTVPLYKGTAVGLTMVSVMAVSGSVTFDSTTGEITITGNGTITVRPE